MMKKLTFTSLLALLFTIQLVAQDNPFGTGAASNNKVVTPPKLYISPFFGYGWNSEDQFDLKENIEKSIQVGANVSWKAKETLPVLFMSGLSYLKHSINEDSPYNSYQAIQIPLILKSSPLCVKGRSGFTIEIGGTASFLLNEEKMDVNDTEYEYDRIYNKNHCGGLVGLGYRFSIGQTAGIELFSR